MVAFGSTLLTSLLWLSTLSNPSCATEQIDTDPYFISPPGIWPGDDVRQDSKDVGDLEFTLRHVYHHGTHKYPNLHRYLDVPDDAQLAVADDTGRTSLPNVLRARVVSTDIQRLADRNRSRIDGMLDYALRHGQPVSLPSSAWTVDRIAGPDITNRSTIISLAWMAANAYVEEPFEGDWHDVEGGFNNTDDFGWQNDGLRGHVFATKDNSTVVLGLKGTSPAIFDGPDTTGNDKLNDNLFGSCCCAQGGDYWWKTVCECQTTTFTCNQTCLVQALRQKSHYYQASQDLYHNVTERYPNSNIWLSGHSLGGVLGTLVGLTYGLPVVTFEAYPDAMAANRLGLPTPPGYRIGAHQSRTDVNIHHFGHTADPIFVGQCHGTWSACSIAGYAFEGACHTGKKCTYDTVNDKNWKMGIGYHSIKSVIETVLEAYNETAECTEQLDCTDCYNWKFFESNGTETTTSSVPTSTSTYTRTRTETCKTPGWWGCLDETTTSTTTTSTSTSTTATCKTPGWFGCNDPVTTASSPSPTSAPTITTTVTTTTTTTPPPSSSSCQSRGWFGRCKDPTSTAMPSSTPSPSNLPTARRKHCVSRHWYGLCKEWRWEPELEELKEDL